MKKIPELPSIVWVILLPLGLIAVIGGIIFTFTAVATVEGVASIIMLVAGFIAVRTGSMGALKSKAPVEKGSSFFLAIGIVFYALMGMAIDQPGNFIYNKPLGVIFCRDGSQFNREVTTLHLLPGRTDILQDFSCIKDDKVVYVINDFEVIVVRFVEYVLIGYAIILLNRILIYRKLQKMQGLS